MIEIENLKINLESLISNSDRVMIFPHKGPDFDAIAASLGVSLISDKLKVDNHIVIGDQMCKLFPGVQKMIEKEKDNHSMIDTEEYKKAKTKKTLNILCDVNKPQLTWVESFNKNRLAIIDHHDVDDETFEAKLRHIDTSATSASEIVTALLSKYKIKIPENIANSLLAGILLDTDDSIRRLSGDSSRVLTTLFNSGASTSKANEFFQEDIKNNEKVQDLVKKGIKFALIMGDEDVEYSKEDLAKAANKLLRCPVNMSFAIGNIGEGIVSISGRSKESVNVGEIMRQLEGGGGPCSGATKLSDTTVDEAGKRLLRVVFPNHFGRKQKNTK